MIVNNPFLVLLLLNVSDGFRIDELVQLNCSALFNVTGCNNCVKDNSLVSECPLWYSRDATTGHCQAGPQLDGIIQQDASTLQTSILECNCMTVEDGALSVGACMYACAALVGYYPLPCNVSQLQNFTCADFNRHGRLCSQCKEGYALPVYSYDLECVKCEDYEYNWLKYLTAAFLPLTLFYILVTLFSISFTSPTLSAVVTVFQIGVNPLQLQVFVGLVKSKVVLSPKLLKVALSFASFWNLDFFRMYYSFCLHPRASAMDIMALEYAMAVFPVFLIGITFALVKLHDHRFKPLVLTWRLIGLILKPLRRQWNVRTSLVDVFASFIYLSSTRLLWTSMGLLVPIKVYTYLERSDGRMQLITKHYLFSVPSVEYFGKEHIPFVILAIVVLFMLFALPMILLFIYPFRLFQCFLNRVRFNSLTLHTFMEVFQGAYKDGTNGTKDYRYFSGFLLFLPLALAVTFSLTQSSFYLPVASLWVLVYLTLHLVFQPFKQKLHNYITFGVITALLGLYIGLTINTSALAWLFAMNLDSDYEGTKSFLSMSIVLTLTSCSVPFLYLLGLACVLTKRWLCSTHME